MPSGFSEKKRATAYRLNLLARLPASDSEEQTDISKQMGINGAAQHQLGEMVRFGWVSQERARYRRTAIGDAVLEEHKDAVKAKQDLADAQAEVGRLSIELREWKQELHRRSDERDKLGSQVQLLKEGLRLHVKWVEDGTAATWRLIVDWHKAHIALLQDGAPAPPSPTEYRG